MKPFTRIRIALFLMAIYTLITISPAVQCAMRSASVVHAVAGECTGECDTCGCSPERSGAHTCCCWQKKQRHHESHNEQDADCCKKAGNSEAAVTIASCPCGSGKLLVLWGSEHNELLPYQCAEKLPHPFEAINQHTLAHSMTSRHGEPPDPPPKLSLPFIHVG